MCALRRCRSGSTACFCRQVHVDPSGGSARLIAGLLPRRLALRLASILDPGPASATSLGRADAGRPRSSEPGRGDLGALRRWRPQDLVAAVRDVPPPPLSANPWPRRWRAWPDPSSPSHRGPSRGLLLRRGPEPAGWIYFEILRRRRRSSDAAPGPIFVDDHSQPAGRAGPPSARAPSCAIMDAAGAEDPARGARRAMAGGVRPRCRWR